MRRYDVFVVLAHLLVCLVVAASSTSHGCRSAAESEETDLYHHSHWQTVWGRSGASWPRRGFDVCWAERGAVCALPTDDHVVCLPGSRRGSTLNRGWAMDPRTQSCRPGGHCLYACEPGYYWTQFNRSEASSYDGSATACDAVSTHGVYCDDRGEIQKPYPGPLCALGETYVYAENRLDTHVFLCQTVFPGHEIFLIPTLVRPGETVMITTQPRTYWTEPTSSKPTHTDFYVSFAGADIMEACVIDEFSPSGAALLPYEIGSGVEDNGVVYSTHYFYQQPNSEVPTAAVGYDLQLECVSRESGVCGQVTNSSALVKVDVLKTPRRASTRVKFVFKKPDTGNTSHFYREPLVKTIDATTVSRFASARSLGRKLRRRV